jgi:cell division septation protein DedD
MSLEHDHFHEDEDQLEYGPRSIFAAGWFRAVLAMTVLAIIVVVALPYLLNWFEPLPPPVKPSTRSSADAPAVSSSSVSAPAESEPIAPLPQAAPEAPAVHTVPKPAPDRTRPAALTPSASSASARVTRTSAMPPRPDRTAATASRLESAQREGAGRYWVQVGIFREEQNAERLARKLRDEGFSVHLARVRRSEASTSSVPAGAYHVVRAGGFADSARAVAARDALGNKGYSGFVTEGDAK